MKELNVKVGDEVLIRYGGIWETEKITKVTRITPTGRIRVSRDEKLQFDKYGRQMGCNNVYTTYSIHELTPEKRDEIMKKETILECIMEFEAKKDKLTFLQAVDILSILRNGEKK